MGDENYTDDFWAFARTHNYSDGQTIWVIAPTWEVIVKSIAIIPVMIIGLFGNLAVILLILKLKTLRKSHINLFILNMAIADLITTMFCPWIALVGNIYQNYELGPVICKLECSIKILCLLSSVFSLTTISIDRFIAVVYPFKSNLTQKSSYLIILVIWTLAVGFASPLAIWRVYRERPWLDFIEKWCTEENVPTLKYYWLYLMLPLIYFPLLVIVILYSIIIRRMDRFEKIIATNETPVRERPSRTVIQMLFIYILTMFICWFPLQILVYYRRFKTSVELPDWYSNVSFLAQLFASANSAINPIVTFRKSFYSLLPKLFASKKVAKPMNVPMDCAIIQQQIDRCRPSLASDSTQEKIRLSNISKSLQTNTTSFTKQILMERAPEIFMREEI